MHLSFGCEVGVFEDKNSLRIEVGQFPAAKPRFLVSRDLNTGV